MSEWQVNPLQDAHILLGISGGIAAYKTPQLVRLLRQAEAEVQVVMTRSAHQFVTATALQAVSDKAVRDTLWHDAAQGWTQWTVTDGARERARGGYEWCRDKVAYGSFLNMRQCLGSTHDRLMGELNNAYWDALKVGS